MGTDSVNVLRFTPFSPAEEAVLERFFDREAKDPDPTDGMAALVRELAEGVEPCDFGVRAIDIAAAKLVLRNYEDSLPNWSTTAADGSIVYARKLPAPSAKKYQLPSQVLLAINWTDSGPGFGWPEEYRLTWLPLAERFVVTSSRDSDDFVGYTDYALGAFSPSGCPVEDEVETLICGQWRVMKEDSEQEPWEAVIVAGTIGKRRAIAWRKSVWGKRRRGESLSFHP